MKSLLVSGETEEVALKSIFANHVSGMEPE
jgi:hypothetical protein